MSKRRFMPVLALAVAFALGPPAPATSYVESPLPVAASAHPAAMLALGLAIDDLTPPPPPPPDPPPTPLTPASGIDPGEEVQTYDD